MAFKVKKSEQGRKAKEGTVFANTTLDEGIILEEPPEHQAVLRATYAAPGPGLPSKYASGRADRHQRSHHAEEDGVAEMIEEPPSPDPRS